MLTTMLLNLGDAHAGPLFTLLRKKVILNYITMFTSSQCFSIMTPSGSVPMADTNTGFKPRRARHSVDGERNMLHSIGPEGPVYTERRL